MKKRFISLFLVAAICLTMLPTTALADAVVVVPPEGGAGDISVDVTPANPGHVPGIGPGEDGGAGVVVLPPAGGPGAGGLMRGICRIPAR